MEDLCFKSGEAMGDANLTTQAHKQWMKYPKDDLVSLVKKNLPVVPPGLKKKEQWVAWLIEHNIPFPKDDKLTISVPITQRCKSELLHLCLEIDPNFDATLFPTRNHLLQFLKDAGKIHTRKSKGSKTSPVHDTTPTTTHAVRGTSSPVNIAEYINHPEDTTVLQEMILKLLSSSGDVHLPPSVEAKMPNMFE